MSKIYCRYYSEQLLTKYAKHVFDTVVKERIDTVHLQLHWHSPHSTCLVCKFNKDLLQRTIMNSTVNLQEIAPKSLSSRKMECTSLEFHLKTCFGFFLPGALFPLENMCSLCYNVNVLRQIWPWKCENYNSEACVPPHAPKITSPRTIMLPAASVPLCRVLLFFPFLFFFKYFKHHSCLRTHKHVWMHKITHIWKSTQRYACTRTINPTKPGMGGVWMGGEQIERWRRQRVRNGGRMERRNGEQNDSRSYWDWGHHSCNVIAL